MLKLRRPYILNQQLYPSLAETGANLNYVVNLVCNLTAPEPRVSVSFPDGKDRFATPEFRVETALACAPEPVDCIVQVFHFENYKLDLNFLGFFKFVYLFVSS